MWQRAKIRRTRSRAELRQLGFTAQGILVPAILIVSVILIAALLAYAVTALT